MPDTEPLPTALAGHYVLERELGRGGMATVYLAHDLKHGRDVALKVLRPEINARLGPERFLAEIRVTARLDHPHILTLIDSGTAGDLLYYVLPLVRGESLRDRQGVPTVPDTKRHQEWQCDHGGPPAACSGRGQAT